MNSSAVWQLAWAILTVLVVFVAASGTKRTTAIALVILLIPFQTIDNRYASSSVLVAYVLAAFLIVNGGLKTRMLPALGLIVLAYLVSFSQADRVALQFHLTFMFQFFSCFLVFLLAYNYARLVDSVRTVVDLLLVLNILVVGYCLLQITAGPGQRFIPFGIEELAFNINREPGDPRLVGPFGTPGSTAGYFMLMTLLLSVEAMFSTGARLWFVRFLVVLNLFALIATGNRGAFLVLVAMFPALLLLFRSELGARKVLTYSVGGILGLGLAAAIAVSYTDFNVMFQRLENVTETEDGVPSTRAGTWPVAIEKIKQDPWFGEGPHFISPETAERLALIRSHYDPYPHSLYLYLLRTVGVFGLVTIIWFFVQAGFLIYRSIALARTDIYTQAVLKAGFLIIPAFLMDQIRLEFNRPATMDFAQFIFALVGLMVGLSDRHRDVETAADVQSVRHDSRRIVGLRS